MNCRLAVFCVAICIGGTIGGCSKPTVPLTTLRVGHAPHDHHAPLYVAAMNPAYFKEHGGIYLEEVDFRKRYQLISAGRPVANVEITPSTGGKELIRKLTEGHFDLSFGGVPAMLAFIDDGSPIQIVAPTMAEGAGFMVSKDLPIDSWQTFIDHVRGRHKPFRVGYKIALSVQNLIFERALKEEGVSYSPDMEDLTVDVTLVNLHGAKNLIPCLESGIIDGFVVMQPFLAVAESKGIGRTVALLGDLPPKGKWKGSPCCALAANTPFVQKHQAVVEDFVTLMLRAGKFIKENTAKSSSDVAQWLDVSPAVEALSLPTIDYVLDRDANWDRGVDFWLESMLDSGILDGVLKDAFVEGKQKDLIYNETLISSIREKI